MDRPRLVSVHLFLPGEVDPTDLEGIRKRLDGPVAVAVNGGGEFEFPAWKSRIGGQSRPFKIWIPPLELGSLTIQAATVSEPDGTGEVRGVIVTLPQHLVLAHETLSIIEDGTSRLDKDRAVASFAARYHRALGEVLAEALREHARGVRVPGVQGHAKAFPGLGQGRAVIGLRVANRLAALLSRWFGTKVTAKDLDRMLMVIQRHPVVGPRGAHWVRMRVVRAPNFDDGAIYVDPVALHTLMGGDEDGDLQFSAAPGVVVLPRDEKAAVEMAKALGIPEAVVLDNSEPRVPQFRVLEGGDAPVLDALIEARRAALAEKGDPLDKRELQVADVMAAAVKDVTGHLTYVFDCFMRAVAQTYVRQQGLDSPDGELSREQVRRDAVRRVYKRLLAIKFPLFEAVMDARKKGENPDLSRLAQGLVSVVHSGAKIDPEWFVPFLPPDDEGLIRALREAVRMVNGDLSRVRDTAFGQMLAMWNGLKNGAGRLVRELMGLHGITPEQVLQVLRDDALGVKFTRMVNVPRRSRPKPEEPVPISWQDGEKKDASSILSGMTFVRPEDGAAVRLFPTVKTVRNSDGTTVLEGVFVPAWLKPGWDGYRPSYKVRVHLPKAEKLGTKGHVRLSYPGKADMVIYRPRLRLEEGRVVKITLRQFFAEAILAELVDLWRYSRESTRLDADRLQRSIDRRVKESVRSLPSGFDPEDRSFSEAAEAVLACEYEIDGLAGAEDLPARWATMEKILRILATEGLANPDGTRETFCVAATSKGSPGTIVGTDDGDGLPRWSLQINPAASLMAMKRLADLREVRAALELANPGRIKVTLKGYDLPPELATRLVGLNVAVADATFNVFEDKETGKLICHDTLWFCPSGREWLELHGGLFSAGTKSVADKIVERLMANGVPADQIVVEPVSTDLGGGVVVDRYVVRITGDWTDTGKVKFVSGGIKGVMHVLPYQLYVLRPDGRREPIDVIVPRDTIIRKDALDAVLLMMLDLAGITEIDGPIDLDDIVSEIRGRLVARGYPADGRCPMVTETGRVLGHVLAGTLPAFRPGQTTVRVSDVVPDVHLDTTVMILTGLGFDADRRDPAQAVAEVIKALATAQAAYAAWRWAIPPYARERFDRMVGLRSESDSEDWSEPEFEAGFE